MKKIDFMSPEALLQAEIFGNGNGGNPNIIDVYDQFLIDGYDQLIAGYAYYDNTLHVGVYYFEFEATSTSPAIQINSDYRFQDFVSNNIATESLQEISFTVTIGEHIIIGGLFGKSER